jgi:hypothetical protein
MSDIRLLKLASYIKPEPVENKGKNWVLNGPKNEFYQYIIDMNSDSSTNGSLNKTYADLIYGKGLRAKNARTNIEGWAKFKTILSNKDLHNIITDFQVFTGATMQVEKTKGGDLYSIGHVPEQFVVPSIENEEGEIEGYWYSKDWTNTTKTKPEYFNAFGGSKDPIEIYRIKPYSVGSQYFSSPDYQSGLVYAEMEREIANLTINYVKNGLSAGYIINIPDSQTLSDEEKDRLERKIKQKLTGSGNAGSFIMSFQARDQEPITITVFPVADNIHKQWDSLYEVARQKILTAHRCTSPAIAGIISSSGFSNTAEEMEQARLDLLKYVIEAKQKQLTDAFEEILVQYGINLDLEFIPITEKQNEAQTQLSEHFYCGDVKKKDNFTEDEGDLMLENLIGETITDEWELVDKRECLEENEDIESWAKRLIKPIQLAVIKSKPSDESYLDKGVYKVRYSYQEKYSSGRSRGFCIQMMGRTGSGVVYRLEDIDKASREGINKEFGHKGQSYDLYKFKGGVRCGHFWQEELYRLKKNTDGTYRPDKALSSSEEVENIPKSYRPRPAGHLLAPIAPKDMPNDGHHPNYVKKSK